MVLSSEKTGSKQLFEQVKPIKSSLFTAVASRLKSEQKEKEK